MRNMLRTSILFFAMFMSPVMGFGQNAPQKVAKVDSVKQVVTAVPIHEGMTAESVPSMVSSDTILNTIQDTINRIAFNTNIWHFLGVDSKISNSWIGLLGMIFGLGAAVFAWRGYVYQKKSAKSLEVIEPQRLPYDVFSRIIYENYIVLDILIEIERSDCSEAQREQRRKGYRVEQLLDEIRLPDDLIDLSCYKGQKEYKEAYSIIIEWRTYNSMVNTAKQFFQKKEYEPFVSTCERLKEYVVKLHEHLSTFEDNVSEDPENIRKDSENMIIPSKAKFIRNVVYHVDNPSPEITIRRNEFVDPRLFSQTNNILAIEKLHLIPAKRNTDNNSIKCTLCNWWSVFWGKISAVFHKPSVCVSPWEGFWNGIVDMANKRLDDRNWNYSPVEYLFIKWIKTYASSDKDAREKMNFSFLIRTVFAYNVAEKRYSIIKGNDEFVRSEGFYFGEIERRYAEFGVFFSEEGEPGCATLTFYQFLCAIVAELDLKVTSQYLYSWLYYAPEILPYNRAFCGWTLFRLLQKLGITDDHNEFVIKTKTELDNLLKEKSVSKEMLDYKIYPSSIDDFFGMVENLYGVSPRLD